MIDLFTKVKGKFVSKSWGGGGGGGGGGRERERERESWIGSAKCEQQQ